MNKHAIDLDELLALVRRGSSKDTTQIAIQKEFHVSAAEAEALLNTHLTVLLAFPDPVDPGEVLKHYQSTLAYKNKQRWQEFELDRPKDPHEREAYLLDLYIEALKH